MKCGGTGPPLTALVNFLRDARGRLIPAPSSERDVQHEGKRTLGFEIGGTGPTLGNLERCGGTGPPLDALVGV